MNGFKEALGDSLLFVLFMNFTEKLCLIFPTRTGCTLIGLRRGIVILFEPFFRTRKSRGRERDEETSKS